MHGVVQLLYLPNNHLSGRIPTSWQLPDGLQVRARSPFPEAPAADACKCGCAACPVLARTSALRLNSKAPENVQCLDSCMNLGPHCPRRPSGSAR